MAVPRNLCLLFMREVHDTQASRASSETPEELLDQKRRHIPGHCPFPGSVILSFISSMARTSDSSRYRTACESLILQDFQFAISKDTENSLWLAHGNTNNRFRKELKQVCLS